MVTLNLKGSSGSLYAFTVYPITQKFNAVGGVYLFTKEHPTNYHTYVYLGITGDLSTRFDNHHKEKEIKTAVQHIFVCTRKAMRQKET